MRAWWLALDAKWPLNRLSELRSQGPVIFPIKIVLPSLGFLLLFFPLYEQDRDVGLFEKNPPIIATPQMITSTENSHGHSRFDKMTTPKEAQADTSQI
jgi:hypothetical protein